MVIARPAALLLFTATSLACSSDPTIADAAGGADATANDAATSSADGRPPGAFSFFVTSLDTMRAQSGSDDGFGGDFGGLAGADQICQNAAAAVGFGDRAWRAFLSTASGPDGMPVHAIDRIGNGPWFDRNGLLVATGREGILGLRPDGDPRTIDDLPDEYGVPLSFLGDVHDVLTGSDSIGRLASDDPGSTCFDWTSSSSEGTEGKVHCGHSFPRGGEVGYDWISDHTVGGCAPGVYTEQGPSQGACVGCMGGYGAIYCFAID